MWEDEFTCPVCKSDDVVLPYGPKISPVLLIGEHPGKDEIKEGKPFVGSTGAILRNELSYLGVDARKLRMANLWLHEPNKNTECLEHSAKLVLKEAENRKMILLIGSDTVKYFCNQSVEEWNGLLIECVYFPNAKVMVCVQPATAFHNVIGELKFALNNFVSLLKEEKLV